MFTGIIEKIGRIESRVVNSDGSGTLSVAIDDPFADVPAKGDSIAVNGVCLTLGREVKRGKGLFAFNVLAETFGRSNLGTLPEGARVNIERALRADSRLGGHFVTGHIDAACPVSDWTKLGRDWRLAIRCGAELAQLIVQKGSVAVDGVSLTVTDIGEDFFSVQLIPSTIETTALRERKEGKKVNVETDMIGKYVCRCLGKAAGRKGVSLDTLREAGYE